MERRALLECPVSGTSIVQTRSKLEGYGGQFSRGLPAVAHAPIGTRARRLVDQNSGSWNSLIRWLLQLDRRPSRLAGCTMLQNV
jgi:hypothetical protein